MANGRFPVALVLLLAGGTALVLGGLDDRWSRPPVTVAIERLRAGDLDMAERRKSWTALVDRAIAGETLTAVQRLAAAMAAVALRSLPTSAILPAAVYSAQVAVDQRVDLAERPPS